MWSDVSHCYCHGFPLWWTMSLFKSFSLMLFLSCVLLQQWEKKLMQFVYWISKGFENVKYVKSILKEIIAEYFLGLQKTQISRLKKKRSIWSTAILYSTKSAIKYLVMNNETLKTWFSRLHEKRNKWHTCVSVLLSVMVQTKR